MKSLTCVLTILAICLVLVACTLEPIHSQLEDAVSQSPSQEDSGEEPEPNSTNVYSYLPYSPTFTKFGLNR